MEFLSDVYRFLASHGINHKQNFIWVYCLMDSLKFIHKFIINLKTTRRIHYCPITSLGSGFLNTF